MALWRSRVRTPLGPFTAEPKGAVRTVELEEFFSMLRFENRHMLAELGIDLAQELENLI